VEQIGVQKVKEVHDKVDKIFQWPCQKHTPRVTLPPAYDQGATHRVLELLEDVERSFGGWILAYLRR
jgi:hypothetical protein